MPKIKTHKGAWSRFHMTGSGKIMRGKIGGSHLRRNKTPRTKRQYHGQIPIDPTVKARVKRLLPYGAR
ncbi:MAG: 50S ribosomal protein L35 [Chloroflexota bacterium]|nr:50S ribosomal protein L35 [Chloroflexota bacterium]